MDQGHHRGPGVSTNDDIIDEYPIRKEENVLSIKSEQFRAATPTLGEQIELTKVWWKYIVE